MMTTRVSSFLLSNRSRKLASLVRFNHGAATPTSSTSQKSGSTVPDVQGVTKNVVDIPSAALGPGASKAGDYKNPEYFAYHQWSFYEANVEMDKFRLPQPSAVKEN
ncbi:uncharacterized protein LOC111053411 [Nilaparvata lugens]|uniref:uncharacterized protein LOC111053411 n=1 Tax=Nilaparvata lugens TaxID=108931 RepID=UPI00193D69FE|nr:uncharacterized protein LOC111053411 [Nilaparvata lugens]